MIRAVLLIGLNLLVLGAGAEAQNRENQGQTPEVAYTYNQDVENTYQKILGYYRNERYELARVELNNLLEVYPSNHRITGILNLLGRTQYHLGQYLEAQQTLRRLIETYPQSRYIDDAIFTRAAAAFQQNQSYLAAEYLMTLLERSQNRRLLARVESRLVVLFSDYLDADGIGRLRGAFSSEKSARLLQFADAVVQERQGYTAEAKIKLESLLASTPEGALLQETRRRLALLSNRGSGLKLGVILPLSGFFEQEARGLLEGIQYAVLNNPLAQELGIELEIRDSMGEMLTTIDAVRDLVLNERVRAIIGEVESDKTAVIGALAEEHQIPVIAPTAIETGLVRAGKNIFQMSPDVATIGEQIAEYAIDQLDLRSFAILAPADKYGKDITDGFAQKIDQLNGTIVAEAWYYENATDVREQLGRFRVLGLNKMLRDSLSMAMPELSRSQIDSVILAMEESSEQEAAEQDKPKRPAKLSDSTEVAVTAIDGIFLPVYSEHIPYVAPQLALYNIQAQILGGFYWDDLDVLIDNETYVQNAIFPTDYFISESHGGFQDFRNQFRLEMGRSPEKLQISGYDAMNFLLTAMGRDMNQPGDLLANLGEIREFQGLLSRYQFQNESRVNRNVTMLRFFNKSLMQLE